jgi:TonB family protein
MPVSMGDRAVIFSALPLQYRLMLFLVRRWNCAFSAACNLLVCGLLSIPIAAAARLNDDVRPEKVVSMAYPQAAVLSMLQGTVEIECTLSTDGFVKSVTILRGNRILAKPVEANALRWRFDTRPAPLAGQQTKVRLVYSFRLLEDESSPQDSFTFELPNSVTVTAPVRHFNPTL